MRPTSRCTTETEDDLFDIIKDFEFTGDDAVVEGEVWSMYRGTAGYAQDTLLYWDFQMPDGTHFSEPKWRTLYTSMQVCVASMVNARPNPEGGRHRQMIRISTTLRYFVRWMAIFGHQDLSCMDTTRFEDYAHWISLTKCRGLGDASISVLHAYSILSFPALLFYQNEALIEAGLPSIPSTPYGGVGIWDLANKICDKKTESYPAVPDEVFIPAINKVIEWLDCQIEEIHEAVEAYRDNYQGKCIPTQWKYRRIALASLKFSADRNTGLPWFEGFAEPVLRKRSRAHSKARRGQEAELNAGHKIRELVNYARACCSIAIQGLVGLRISEVCGLSVAGERGSNGWPACIQVERSKSGMEELFYIHGTVFKDKEQPRPGRWLAGMRPLGSDYVPIPVKAILVLDTLFAPWREMSGRDDLILSFSNRNGLANRAEKVTPVSASTLREGQQEWMHRFVEVPHEFSHWVITTHQWRKSFARFCVRTDATLLPEISRHLQHVSIRTTERSYTGEDKELRYLIRDAAIELAADIIYQATEAPDQTSGRLADEIHDFAEELHHHVSPDDERATHAFLYETMEHDETWAWELQWGCCLFRPEYAMCHLKNASSGIFRPAAPALDRLGPFSSCNECRNHIVLPRHRVFWQKRRTALLAQRAENRKNGLNDIDFVVAHRLAQCNTILNRIGRVTNEQ